MGIYTGRVSANHAGQAYCKDASEAATAPYLAASALLRRALRRLAALR
jgi:hypothetical protein